jgi:DNA-binding CsgD family transcriptional regulator
MTTVRPIPAWWKWDPRDPGRPRWDVKEEAELLFFDPTRDGGARDAKRAREAAQAAAFLIGMQDLLAASWWIGMGCRVLAALPSARTAAIHLLAIGGMPMAYQSVALTMRAVKGDGHHEKLLILRTWLAFRVYHILLIRTTTVSLEPMPAPTPPLTAPSSAAVAPQAHAGLTPRELDVLRLLAQGLTSPQIAEQLVISVVTVNFHVGVSICMSIALAIYQMDDFSVSRAKMPVCNDDPR